MNDSPISTLSALALFSYSELQCLQCFDTAGRVPGKASGLQKMSHEVLGVVICLK